MDSLEYYARHGRLTEPGSHADRLAALPSDLPAACRFVQGLLLHADWASAYGVEGVVLSRDTLPVARRLELAEHSLPERKTSGTCRDFALMLCSVLRQHAVPARVRCGFATYFTSNPYEDHWVCEYWKADERRWAQADAQLDELMCVRLNVRFATTDLPAGTFLNAAEAWRTWRAGKVPDTAFGHGSEAAGAWFMRVNLMRDRLALRKEEVSTWDAWRSLPPERRILDDDAVAECDRIALCTAGSVL